MTEGEIMEILEKYEKLHKFNLEIPDFNLTKLENEDAVVDDIIYEITKYLGKIQGLISKKLRKLWLKNDGVSIDYSLVQKQTSLEKFLVDNVTEIQMDIQRTEKIELLKQFSRIEKIWIKDSRKFKHHLIDEMILFIGMLKNYISNRKSILTNFRGLFIDTQAKWFDDYYIQPNQDLLLENYIIKLVLVTDANVKIFTFTTTDSVKICSDLEDHKKYYELHKESLARNREPTVLYYLDLRRMFLRLANLKITVKKIKVIMLNDPKTLTYYHYIYLPAYKSIGIDLEMEIIGTSIPCFADKYSHIDPSNGISVHDNTYEKKVIETKFRPDIDLTDYFQDMINRD